jgi:hypothetical protein
MHVPDKGYGERMVGHGVGKAPNLKRQMMENSKDQTPMNSYKSAFLPQHRGRREKSLIFNLLFSASPRLGGGS